ncbi:MAG: hypothetical protein WCI78_01480 [Mycobacterium sp.]|jgi:hypothetical protein
MEICVENDERSQRFSAVADAMSSSEQGTLRQWRDDTETWAVVDGDIFLRD